jgi:hypothetical protein
VETYFRKVIKIRAEDSPNVRRGIHLEKLYGRKRALEEPDGVPGVIGYAEYLYRRAILDPDRQCVVLDAEFYEGRTLLLFPPDWLNEAEARFRVLDARRHKVRKATAVGIDTAEGGDDTAMAAVDDEGLIELVSFKTPDTSVIPGIVIGFIRKWNCDPKDVVFDRGGGGYEHACDLRKQGFPVRAVGFGEAPSVEIRRMRSSTQERRDVHEWRLTYANLRAEMYGELSQLFDPNDEDRWSIPDGRSEPCLGPQYAELRRQLVAVPRWYDEKGKLYLPPKDRSDADKAKDPSDPRKLITMKKLLGCSPDESDALALAGHGHLHPPRVAKAGAGI